jgi:hypothetical protein
MELCKSYYLELLLLKQEWMAPRSRSSSPGAPNPYPSLSPVTTLAPATTPSLSPLGSLRSSLSPDARPFLPSGRSKAQRWEDASHDGYSGGVPSP